MSDGHIPNMRLNNITQFSPLLIVLVKFFDGWQSGKGFCLSVGYLCPENNTVPGGLSDRAGTGGCHMAHWNEPAMRAWLIALTGIIRKIMESDWLQGT